MTSPSGLVMRSDSSYHRLRWQSTHVGSDRFVVGGTVTWMGSLGILRIPCSRAAVHPLRYPTGSVACCTAMHRIMKLSGLDAIRYTPGTRSIRRPEHPHGRSRSDRVPRSSSCRRVIVRIVRAADSRLSASNTRTEGDDRNSPEGAAGTGDSECATPCRDSAARAGANFGRGRGGRQARVRRDFRRRRCR